MGFFTPTSDKRLPRIERKKIADELTYIRRLQDAVTYGVELDKESRDYLFWLFSHRVDELTRLLVEDKISRGITDPDDPRNADD